MIPYAIEETGHLNDVLLDVLVMAEHYDRRPLVCIYRLQHDTSLNDKGIRICFSKLRRIYIYIHLEYIYIYILIKLPKLTQLVVSFKRLEIHYSYISQR